MRKQFLFMLLVLLAGLISLPGYTLVPSSGKKKVEAVLEFYPNYAAHLLGLAQIGNQSDYSETFMHIIDPLDLQILKKSKDLLYWDNGDEGILSYFFLTFPGYVNPASKTHLAEYLTDLNSAIAARSFDDFREKYKYYINELERWNGFTFHPAIFNYSEEIQIISRIFMNNYDSFRAVVWPEYEDQLNRLAEAMNEKFDEWDLIRRWEKLTGQEYQSPLYRVTLSLGMVNGPSGKALGYDKQWYYYGTNPPELLHRICVETGFRMLADFCAKNYDTYNPNTCFEVYRTMAEYLTDQIFADLGLSDIIGKSAFASNPLYSMFDIIQGVNPDLGIDVMYSIALDTYSRSKYAMLSD